jgi:hypothetical protein
VVSQRVPDLLHAWNQGDRAALDDLVPQRSSAGLRLGYGANSILSLSRSIVGRILPLATRF